MWLVSFDPGKTTGYAICEDERLVEFGSFKGWEMLVQLITTADVVIYENITVPSKAFDLSGVYIIGVIRYLCGIHGVKCVPRVPAFMSGARRWGCPEMIEGDPHAADAVAHAAAFLGPSRIDLSLIGVSL